MEDFKNIPLLSSPKTYSIYQLHNNDPIRYRCNNLLFILKNQPIFNCHFEKTNVEFVCEMDFDKTQKINNCHFDSKSKICQNGQAPLEIRNSIIESLIVDNSSGIDFYKCTISGAIINSTRTSGDIRFFECKIMSNVFNKYCSFNACTFHLKLPILMPGEIDDISKNRIIAILLKDVVNKDVLGIIISY